jgi:hypothetical protein
MTPDSLLQAERTAGPSAGAEDAGTGTGWREKTGLLDKRKSGWITRISVWREMTL